MSSGVETAPPAPPTIGGVAWCGRTRGRDRMWRWMLGAIGIGIALVSGFFVAAAVVEDGPGGHGKESAAVVESATGGDGKTSPGVYAGLIFFFGGAFLVGAYLAWRMLRSRRATGG